VKLYCALIYPFLTYGILIWGDTYATTLKPIFILQKKTVRIITFSTLDSHSSPLFKSVGIIKFFDIALFQIAIVMYKFHHNVLPAPFYSFFFTKVTSVHYHNTRLAAKHSYYLPYARTNYGKFSIGFQAPSVWNTIDDNVKLSSSIPVFTKGLKDQYFERYLTIIPWARVGYEMVNSQPGP